MADRLTELPDSLILEILSLQEMRDVVRTTILSKRWKTLWTTVPCLDFRYDTSSSDNKVAFRNFVSRALANWKGAKILKFSLRFETEWSFPSSILDSWLLFAIKKQVEELYISLYKSQIGYRAPQRLCFCSSIRRLTLLRCDLKSEEGVQWNRLESLTIDSQHDYPLIEKVVNQILRGAPRLEFLNLELIESGEDLNIQSDSLKMLKIARCRGEMAGVFSVFHGADKAILRIQTPNLDNLEISKIPYARCLLKVPSLTTASLGCKDPCKGTYDKPKRITLVKEMLRQVLPSIHHVENVTLSNMCSKVLFEIKEDMLIQFPNAKFLKLCLSASSSDKILGVLEMFPQLMILTLAHKNMLLFVKPLLELDMEPKTILPSLYLLHLRKVEIAWPLHDISTIILVIKFLLENAPLLEKMVLRPRSVVDNLALLSLVEEKLQTMPRSSPTAEVIISKDSLIFLSSCCSFIMASIIS